MVNLFEEEVIALKAVPRAVPLRTSGKPVNVSTVLRWVQHGVNGIRLEAVRVGKEWVTSKQALARWVERLTAQSLAAAGCEAGDSGPRTPVEVRQAADRASAALAARGA